MSYCAYCQRGAAPEAQFCPQCGQEFVPASPLPAALLGYPLPQTPMAWVTGFSATRVVVLLFLLLVVVPALFYDLGSYLMTRQARAQAARMTVSPAPDAPALPAPVVLTRPNPAPVFAYRRLMPPTSMPPGGYPLGEGRDRRPIMIYRPMPPAPPSENAPVPVWPDAAPASGSPVSSAPSPPDAPSPAPPPADSTSQGATQ